MSDGYFNIFAAVRRAYIFIGMNRGYLARLAILPLALHLISGLAVNYYRPEASLIEITIWMFPASVALSWLVFLQTRLLLLGESVDRLPQDAGYLQDRARVMQLCVIIMLLFQMTCTIFSTCLQWILLQQQPDVEPKASILPFLFLVMGVMLWGLRFSALHILAVVDYPFRPFLRRVRGMEFSLRLLGMGMLCVLPVWLLLTILLEMFFGDVEKLTQAQATMGIIIGAPVSILIPLLLNAAAAYAIKDILSKPQKGGAA